MKSEIINKTKAKITDAIGIPLHFRAVIWRQKGNGTEEWSWHRSNLLSRNNRPPKTHTTRFSINRYPDGKIGFGVKTTHALKELKQFLNGLASGHKESNRLIKKLKSLGFEIEVRTAQSNSDDLLVIRNWKDAQNALKIIKKSKFPWYDSTFSLLSPTIVGNSRSWCKYLDQVMPSLVRVFWLHFLGKNYWSVTSQKKVLVNKAHINTALKKQLIELEGAKCQNKLCKKRKTNVQVCHLDPSKKRDLISNVVLLCGTCHALQKQNAVCKPKPTRQSRLYKITFPERLEGGLGHWMIISNHKLN